MEEKNTQEPVCCPEFNPEPWNDKTFEWNNKTFIRSKVFTIFRFPLNFGNVMRKLDAQIRNAGGEMDEGICLSEHTSNWNMDVYLAVNKEISGADNTKLNGKFYCRVYEGPYSNTGKWYQDFCDQLKNRSMKPGRWFMWYTTCPKCAKKYGKNYVAILTDIN